MILWWANDLRSWVQFLLGTQIFLCPTLMSCWFFHHFIAELKNSFSSTTTTSTLLFLAVCRTHVLHELSLMALLSMSSRGSVDGVPPPPGVWEVMGLIPVVDSDFFFVPSLCHLYNFIKELKNCNNSQWDPIKGANLGLSSNDQS